LGSTRIRFYGTRSDIPQDSGLSFGFAVIFPSFFSFGVSWPLGGRVRLERCCCTEFPSENLEWLFSCVYKQQHQLRLSCCIPHFLYFYLRFVTLRALPRKPFSSVYLGWYISGLFDVPGSTRFYSVVRGVIFIVPTSAIFVGVSVFFLLR